MRTAVPGSVAPIPSTAGAGGAPLLARIDGPPPPVPPDVMTRDTMGAVTVRAIKLGRGLRLDGKFDEPGYDQVLPVTGLVQQVPNEGAPASEKTEVWIMFDETDLFVGARLWDSAPSSEWVVNEMRRDAFQTFWNENFRICLDTLYDLRSGVGFYTNPLGALSDQQFVNEGAPNQDWNPI